MTISSLTKQAEKFIIDNSPSLLTAVGVAGTVTTAYLTGKAAFKSAEILIFETNTRIEEHEKFLTRREEVEMVWKLYIPAVGAGVVTVASIIAANRVGTRRAAAMAASYTILERGYSEYREKVVQKIGEKKEDEVRTEIAQDRVNRTGAHDQQVVIASGEVLCFDSITGRYFYNTHEGLRKAQNDLNETILNDGYATLSDFYNTIGLEATSISDELGWNSDNKLDLRFSTVMSKDNKPCLSIEFTSAPVRDYYLFR